jgi:hypothetical protein
MSPGDLVEKLAGAFDVAEAGREELIGIARESGGPPSVGFAAKGLDPALRLTLRDPGAMAAAAPEHSEAWRGTDVAVLHELVLRAHLGFTPERILRKDGIDFVKDAAAAVDDASASERRFAFVVRPTMIEQMRRIAGAGELMPQKSTYFYPKLTTGLVMRAMDV